MKVLGTEETVNFWSYSLNSSLANAFSSLEPKMILRASVQILSLYVRHIDSTHFMLHSNSIFTLLESGKGTLFWMVSGFWKLCYKLWMVLSSAVHISKKICLRLVNRCPPWLIEYPFYAMKWHKSIIGQVCHSIGIASIFVCLFWCVPGLYLTA